jgi:hypothetical protein
MPQPFAVELQCRNGLNLLGDHGSCQRFSRVAAAWFGSPDHHFCSTLIVPHRATRPGVRAAPPGNRNRTRPAIGPAAGPASVPDRFERCAASLIVPSIASRRPCRLDRQPQPQLPAISPLGAGHCGSHMESRQGLAEIQAREIRRQLKYLRWLLRSTIAYPYPYSVCYQLPPKRL